MTPRFDDPHAARRWNDYFAAIDRLLAERRGRPSALRFELESHLAESFASIDCANRHSGGGRGRQ